MNINQMKDYLGIVLRIEKYTYFWNNSLAYVNNAISSTKGEIQKSNQLYNSKDEERKNVDKTVEANRKKEKGKYEGAIGGAIFLVIVYGISFLLGGDDRPPLWALILIVAIVFGIPILSVAISSIKKYRAKNEWEKEKERRKKAIDNEKSAIATKITQLEAVSDTFVRDKNTILDNLHKAKRELDALYSLNLIPPKYRNIVAVATMYEYLANRRCTTIEGHGGIYDTYEYDCKLGIIINNLTELNQKMDVVIKNQQLLYKEIRSVNSELKTIRSQMDTAIGHLDQISQNTAITARASYQMAEIQRSAQWRAWANGYLT